MVLRVGLLRTVVPASLGYLLEMHILMPGTCLLGQNLGEGEPSEFPGDSR